MEDGQRIWREMEEVDSGDAAHANWPDRFFAKIVDLFLAHSGNKGGRVGAAMAYIISSNALLEFALGVMKAVAADACAADDLEIQDGQS